MKLAAEFCSTMDGSPFVYYGEELGMNSRVKRTKTNACPCTGRIRTPRRTPLPPSGADSVVQKFPALDVQISDPLSMYSYYKSAVRIRNENPELARGATEIVTSLTSGSVCAVTKTYNENTILVCYNIGETSASVALSDTAFAKYRLYNALSVDEQPVTLEKGVLTLPPCAIAVLRQKAENTNKKQNILPALNGQDVFILPLGSVNQFTLILIQQKPAGHLDVAANRNPSGEICSAMARICRMSSSLVSSETNHQVNSMASRKSGSSCLIPLMRIS